MKKFLGIIVLVLILVGCETSDILMSWYNPFVGKWKLKDSSQGPLIVKFRKDYVYEVDVDGNGTKDIWGVYKILPENQINFKDEGGEITNDCLQPAAYQYKFSREGIRFILIGDECSARRQALSTPWQKVRAK